MILGSNSVTDFAKRQGKVEMDGHSPAGALQVPEKLWAHSGPGLQSPDHLQNALQFLGADRCFSHCHVGWELTFSQTSRQASAWET